MTKHQVPIFKTGAHTSSNGFSKNWTEQDLDRIVETYNAQPAESRHDAPAVIGHPKSDGPAYGFFEKLKREGELLYGELRDAKTEFIDWVKAGHYRKVSPKIDSNFLLKHVGWLGAQPPAVKGLPEFSFSNADQGEAWDIEFSEGDSLNDDQNMNGTQKKREGSTNEQDGTESKAGTPAAGTGAAAGGTQATPAATGDAGTATVSAVEFAEYQKKQQAEADQLRKDLAEQRDKNRELEFSEYLGSDKLKGRVTPAMRPGLTRIMKTLADAETYEFSEVDGEGKATEVKRQPLDELKGLLERLPESVHFGEMATEGASQSATAEFSEAQEKEADNLIDQSLGGA